MFLVLVSWYDRQFASSPAAVHFANSRVNEQTEWPTNERRQQNARNVIFLLFFSRFARLTQRKSASKWKSFRPVSRHSYIRVSLHLRQQLLPAENLYDVRTNSMTMFGQSENHYPVDEQANELCTAKIRGRPKKLKKDKMNGKRIEWDTHKWRWWQSLRINKLNVRRQRKRRKSKENLECKKSRDRQRKGAKNDRKRNGKWMKSDSRLSETIKMLGSQDIGLLDCWPPTTFLFSSFHIDLRVNNWWTWQSICLWFIFGWSQRRILFIYACQTDLFVVFRFFFLFFDVFALNVQKKKLRWKIKQPNMKNWP